ncbi:Vps5 C terminal like-domain-containing protein [Geranomyces variabilis]|nr:Vps5 C terminal like-domain-containing protein [Geranomyces variabilis]KAJ3142250.1 Vacuolar protein sorting-associated protein 17 [Geranomyces variabilis]
MQSPRSPRSPRSPTSPRQELSVSVTHVTVDFGAPVFHISAQTPLSGYLRSTCAATRLHKELDRLYEYLCSAFPEHIPPVPPSAAIGPGAAEREVLRAAAEAFLQRVADHDVFRISEGFKMFLESDFEFVPPPATPPRRPATGLLRAFGSSLSNVKEVDVFFDQARAATTAMETGLLALGKAIEKAAKVEKECAKATGEVGTQLSTMTLNENKTIVRATRTLGKGFLTCEKQRADQAVYLGGRLTSTLLTTQLRNAHTAQAALEHRTRTLLEYETACRNTQKKLQAMERLRSTSRIQQEKVDAALDELQEAKQVEAECRAQFRSASDVLKTEHPAFAALQERELAQILNEYARCQAADSRKQLENWEQVLADISIA